MRMRFQLIDDDFGTNYYHRLLISEVIPVSEIAIHTYADEALTYLQNEGAGPDILFLDINMPRKSGWEFLDEYAGLPEQQQAKKLIMVSTSQLPEDRARAMQHPLVDDFFQKPLSLENIDAFVQEMRMDLVS